MSFSPTKTETFCLVFGVPATFPLTHIGAYQLNASVAIFVLPILFAINDIVTEIYGKSRARNIIWSGTAVMILISLFALLAVSLPPSSLFTSQEQAYDQIFKASARISIASLASFVLADLLDVFIFSRMREKLGKKHLWLRTNASNFISLFADTTLFITLAFYSLALPIEKNVTFLTSLILPYWLLKCCMSIIETPFVYLGSAWLRTGDKNDIQ